MFTEAGDYSPRERAALTAWWLAAGEQFTCRELAERFGVGRICAWKILTSLARVLPIGRNRSGRYGAIKSGPA